MFFFVVVLRVLAACLITNSHYTGIYPSDIIANGGLLGDILFFAVSGYCLFNVKKSFPIWYGKRLLRVYPPVLIITIIYFIFGFYSFKQYNLGWWFIYPTNYHFVSSILLLYIPFYFVGRFDVFRKRIPLLMIIVALAYLLVYICVYDKTYYHIDDVREWMVRFLFFESMLLGAYFRYNQKNYHNKYHWWLPVVTIVFFALYFTSKMFVSRYVALSRFQIINQFIIFALLFFLFWLFASLDEKMERMPKTIKKILTILSEITLEIYVVQSVIIDIIRPYHGFPLNWLLITMSILGAAFVLHFACKYLIKGLSLAIGKTKKAFKKKTEKS